MQCFPCLCSAIVLMSWFPLERNELLCSKSLLTPGTDVFECCKDANVSYKCAVSRCSLCLAAAVALPLTRALYIQPKDGKRIERVDGHANALSRGQVTSFQANSISSLYMDLSRSSEIHLWRTKLRVVDQVNPREVLPCTRATFALLLRVFVPHRWWSHWSYPDGNDIALRFGGGWHSHAGDPRGRCKHHHIRRIEILQQAQ